MDSNNPPDDINLVFYGTDGEEAESFISSVLRTARIEGKIRDNDWIVDLVSTCMRGKALRWYIELDEDTQSDWKLLRKAILRQYTSPGQPPAAAPSLQPTIPIPAASATPPNLISHNHSIQVSYPIYRIRLYFANTKSDFFLRNKGADSGVYLTSSDEKAFMVGWTPGNELRLIENGLETQRLIGLTWYYPSSAGHNPGSKKDFGLLLISDSLTDLPRRPSYRGATRVVSWTVNQKGWLESYSDYNQTRYQHHFFTLGGGVEDSLAEICLPLTIKHLEIRPNRVFTMKLEPV